MFDHTALCLDHATTMRDAVPRPLVFMLAVLFHDLGKAATTKWKDGRLRAHAHDTAGESLARTACARLTREQAVADEVAALVRLHLRPGQLGAQGSVSDAAVRRLALEADLRMLAAVSDADGRGRVLPSDACGDSRWLLEHAERLRVRDAAPKPLLLGRRLIELGVRPGPELGRLLAAVFQPRSTWTGDRDARSSDHVRACPDRASRRSHRAVAPHQHDVARHERVRPIAPHSQRSSSLRIGDACRVSNHPREPTAAFGCAPT
ncbi:MAG: HD domain-containing protein [Planctomycetes bacterium]|nr:HD domain-containing protein [Planctomycetota bacterium]